MIIGFLWVNIYLRPPLFDKSLQAASRRRIKSPQKLFARCPACDALTDRRSGAPVLFQTYVETCARPLAERLLRGAGLEAAPGAGFAFFATQLFRALRDLDNARSLLVVAASNAEAEALAAEAELFLSESDLLFLPGFESIPYEYSGLSSDIGLQRVRALMRLAGGKSHLVFTSVDAMLRRTASIDRLRKARLHLQLEQELAPAELARRLVALGYRREARVEAPGEFCLKGSMLDVFSVEGDAPLRIEYFDDLIESMRHFDIDTQVGGERVAAAEIVPAGEIVLSEAEAATLRKALEGPAFRGLRKPPWSDANHNDEAISQLHHPGVEDLFPLATETERVLDAFPATPAVLIYPGAQVADAAARIHREFETLFAEAHQERAVVPPDRLLLSLDAACEGALPVEPDVLPVESEGPSTAEQDAGSAPASAIHGLRSTESFRARIGQVRSALVELASAGARVAIASPYPAQMRRIAGLFRGEDRVSVQLLEEAGAFAGDPPSKKPATIFVVRSAQRAGFSAPAIGFHLFTDGEIFGRSQRRTSRFKRLGSSPIESFLDLKEGDYVVHINHGVGRFLQLEKIRAAGRERDFLVLEYADSDRLYVPLDQISMVQRYIAPTEKPRLDHLGKASFKKIRERVQERIEEFAQELVRLYALRMARKGFAFPADTAWQEEFEAEFPYEETPDQMQAIESVKRDMEAIQPMDRLVCGDVGYGKTEVAIRAAFKAVMSGKQVLVICPTTILAMQHFRNFRERFRNYPISVDWVSRFRTRGEANSVRDRLNGGEIDVVIGTHALLARDVRPRNLGLLVIDEEQRFGVSHKEAIKKIKALVDVLALSATPIPRTLHMSLVGIRDLSVIATPPQDRLPVQTFVLEENDMIVREAVARELQRGGQIFFLHNRIDSIEAAADRLRELVPEARLAVLHGQMLEDEIEDVLVQFMEKRFDVLVTTAIIENGIDLPNVNTLIVDRADTFGLSQLYQIRGRVGRSSRQAYAYFLYQPGRVLTETAQKRLNTLLEYQDLGSGFKVAMRDLEIRGAGNILGREQSGHIMDVGYELYVKLLEDAVHRLQGEEVEAETRCTVNLNADFFLPEEYIPDTRQRIEFYKRFEAARDYPDIEQLHSEMEDRFGPLPPAAQTFVRIEEIRAMASLAGFESVYQSETGQALLKAGDHFRIKPAELVGALARISGLSLNPAQPQTLFFQASGDLLAPLSAALRALTESVRPAAETAPPARRPSVAAGRRTKT